MKHPTIHTKKAPPMPVALEGLSRTSRALYGLAQAYEAESAEQGNESIDEVLHDWPGNAADEWLKEHCGWLDR